MGKSFGEAMVEKLDELKSHTPDWEEDDLRLFTWLYWAADQIEDEINDWYKRHEMAENTLKHIRECLDKINIWEDQDRQMKDCLQNVNQELKVFKQTYDAYSSKRADHYIKRKEPE